MSTSLTSGPGGELASRDPAGGELTSHDPAGVAAVRLTERAQGDGRWPVLVWACGSGWRMLSTAIVGGGLGERRWWLNSQVSREYFEPDPEAHARSIASGLGLSGPGVALLTAADVRYRTAAEDEGVGVVATVGLALPVPAAATPERIAAETAPRGPGTINLLVVVPAPLADAALVNLVVTATEAKTQALIEAGIPGTGTSSDAVCIACPREGGSPPEVYGGPRSLWGARAARAVHAAVAVGAAEWLQRNGTGDIHPTWAR